MQWCSSSNETSLPRFRRYIAKARNPSEPNVQWRKFCIEDTNLKAHCSSHMAVALIITGLSTGGAEMMFCKVLERLDAWFAPHVISLTTIGEIGSYIQMLGIPVEALGMQPGAPSPLSFFRLVGRLKTLKPDVV